jgi:hypothetical protein
MTDSRIPHIIINELYFAIVTKPKSSVLLIPKSDSGHNPQPVSSTCIPQRLSTCYPPIIYVPSLHVLRGFPTKILYSFFVLYNPATGPSPL